MNYALLLTPRFITVRKSLPPFFTLMHTHTPKHIHTCLCVYKCVSKVCVLLCVCIYIYICMCISICVCVYICKRKIISLHPWILYWNATQRMHLLEVSSEDPFLGLYAFQRSAYIFSILQPMTVVPTGKVRIKPVPPVKMG